MPCRTVMLARRVFLAFLALFVSWTAFCFGEIWWHSRLMAAADPHHERNHSPELLYEERRGAATRWAVSLLLAAGCVGAYAGGGARNLFRVSRSRWAGVAADATPDALFVTGRDLRIRYWNHAAERLFGHEGGELDRKPLGEVLPVASEMVEAAAQHVGSHTRTRLRAMHRDGRRIPVEVTLTSRWLEGEPGFVAIARVNRPQSSLESGYRDEARLLTDLFDATPSPIVFIDPLGSITRMNQTAQRLLGWTAPEARGARYWDFALSGPEAARAEAEFSALEATQGLAPVTEKWRTASGVYREISWKRNLCRDDQGNIRGVVAIGQPAEASHELMTTAAAANAAVSERNT